MKELILVKIGGNTIDDPPALARFLDDFARIAGPKILLHGGGKKATALAAQLGVPVHIVQGRRITDAATLDIAVMVYAGLINKNIVAGLQARSCPAVGLCGADAGCITAVKRPVKDVDFGFVGDIVLEKIDKDFFHSLLAQGITPVIAPLTHDGGGQLLNTNADTMASAVAVAMAALYDVRLIYCFEKRGVLRDVNDALSVIPELSAQEYEALKAQGAVSAGMIPKLDNAFSAIRQGVTQVAIGDARYLPAIVAGDTGGATRCV
ncbi:MAG: acetylglutamate kinase [Saprospiraceae bacterium]|nr:acetylglutamate kinase [Saprospiraceae bacterium]